MRNVIIPVKTGNITTKDGTTLNIGKGWFVKEPPEEMIEAYKDIEIHPLHNSDMRMALARDLVNEDSFEETKDEPSEELVKLFGLECFKFTNE